MDISSSAAPLRWNSLQHVGTRPRPEPCFEFKSVRKLSVSYCSFLFILIIHNLLFKAFLCGYLNYMMCVHLAPFHVMDSQVDRFSQRLIKEWNGEDKRNLPRSELSTKPAVTTRVLCTDLQSQDGH